MVDTHLRIDEAAVDLLEPVERIGWAKHHHYELRGATNVFVTVTGGPVENWIGTNGRVSVWPVRAGIWRTYGQAGLAQGRRAGLEMPEGLSIWMPYVLGEPSHLVAIFTKPGLPVPPADLLSAWLRLTFLPDDS